MAELGPRTSAAGLVASDTDGQVLTSRGGQMNWESPATPTPAVWDHVVRSLSDLPTPAAGLINLTAGSWAFPAALDIGANIIVVPGGVECHLKGWAGRFLTGSSTNLIAVNGVAFLETMALSNDAPLLLSGVGALCTCLACDIYAVSACVLSTIDFGYLQVIGGFWQRFAGTPAGLYIAGDLDHVQISGVIGRGLTNFILHDSGAVQQCTVRGCVDDATNGINWAAANIPSEGLLVVGNEFSGATPFNGFVVGDARVNCKANLGSGGLLSETAIVP